jgi:hypothetical protein
MEDGVGAASSVQHARKYKAVVVIGFSFNMAGPLWVGHVEISMETK